VLIFDKKFDEAVVDSLIQEYRDTIGFANLRAADTTETSDNDQQSEQQDEKPSAIPGLPKLSKPTSSDPKDHQSGQPATPAMSQGIRYLAIPLDIGDAPIPVGMSEDDFQLLLDTLQLWKKKIVMQPRRAVWHSDEGDKAVLITKYLWEEKCFLTADGRHRAHGRSVVRRSKSRRIESATVQLRSNGAANLIDNLVNFVGHRDSGHHEVNFSLPSVNSRSVARRATLDKISPCFCRARVRETGGNRLALGERRVRKYLQKIIAMPLANLLFQIQPTMLLQGFQVVFVLCIHKHGSPLLLDHQVGQ